MTIADAGFVGRSADAADAATVATATYDAAGELASATYVNGTSLASVGKDPAGKILSLNWKASDNVQIGSTVGRTRAGTVVGAGSDCCEESRPAGRRDGSRWGNRRVGIQAWTVLVLARCCRRV